MKRNSNQQPLKEVIEKLLKVYKLEDKLHEIDINKSWKVVMGHTVSNRTTNIYLKNKVLFVKLSSSVLRNELSMGKDKVVELLNGHIGRKVINEVRFV